MEWKQEGYTVTTDKSKIDLAVVHHFLSNSYWAKDIPVEVVQRCIDGAMCFSVVEGQTQVGFARVITDEASFAYLADVFILESHRGRGLSKFLMESILSHPSLQNLRRFLLATRDAHGLYAQFGFQQIPSIDPWMQRHDPHVYEHWKEE